MSGAGVCLCTDGARTRTGCWAAAPQARGQGWHRQGAEAWPRVTQVRGRGMTKGDTGEGQVQWAGDRNGAGEPIGFLQADPGIF